MTKKKTPSKAKKKATKKKATPVMRSQFWVIDTGTLGMSYGTVSAEGPYPTQDAAEAYIEANARDLWEDSGELVSAPLHIVEVRRTVNPEINVNVVLIDVGKDESEA